MNRNIKPKTIAQKPEVLTVKEVADYLRVTEITVQRLARKGIIGFKVGNLWRFKRSEIDNFKGCNP